MRIIAGEYRGRRLKTLGGLAVRPTSDKLRETLFNIIRAEVPDSVFIDCYAGSGAVGLEALSRGAREVFLIEKNPGAGRIIDENISALDAGPSVRIVRADVKAALRRLEDQGVRADICFLDPPYASLQEALRNIEWIVSSSGSGPDPSPDSGTLLDPEGLIILEHARRDASPERVGKLPDAWERVRLLMQGSSALSFYRKTR